MPRLPRLPRPRPRAEKPWLPRRLARLLERDGLVALAGAGIVIVSAALFSGVAFAFLTAAGHTVRQLGFTGG